MLTATYTLVALSVEQTNMRVGLHAVQQLVQRVYTPQPALTAGQAEYVCDTLRRLYEQCHRRKLDKFLLPALRRAGADANPLLGELDMLSRNAAVALDEACALLAEGIDSQARVDAFCVAVERFCSALTTRFEREERELYPVARTAIAVDAWFAVANQMLAHDAYVEEHRGRRSAPAGRHVRIDHAYRQEPSLAFAH